MEGHAQDQTKTTDFKKFFNKSKNMPKPVKQPSKFSNKEYNHFKSTSTSSSSSSTEEFANKKQEHYSSNKEFNQSKTIFNNKNYENSHTTEKKPQTTFNNETYNNKTYDKLEPTDILSNFSTKTGVSSSRSGRFSDHASNNMSNERPSRFNNYNSNDMSNDRPNRFNNNRSNDRPDRFNNNRSNNHRSNDRPDRFNNPQPTQEDRPPTNGDMIWIENKIKELENIISSTKYMSQNKKENIEKTLQEYKEKQKNAFPSLKGNASTKNTNISCWNTQTSKISSSEGVDTINKQTRKQCAAIKKTQTDKEDAVKLEKQKQKQKIYNEHIEDEFTGIDFISDDEYDSEDL